MKKRRLPRALVTPSTQLSNYRPFFLNRWLPVFGAWTIFFVFRNHSFFTAIRHAPYISWSDIAASDLYPTFALLVAVPVLVASGRLVLVFFRADKFSFLQRIALSFVLGTGLWSILMTGLGAAGLLNATIIESLGGLLLLVGLTQWGNAFNKNISLLWIAIQQWNWTWPRALWLGFLAWGLSNAWFQSLLPPAEQDTIAHHFAHIKLWAEQGHLFELRWLEHSQFPLHSEMLYMSAMVLHLDTLAQGLHWSFSFFLVVGLFAFWSERFGAEACLLGSAIMVTLPLVSQYSGTGHNEMVWSCYLVLSVSVLLMAPLGDRRTVVLAGLLAGFAASCRYNGIFAVACFTLAAFIMSRRLGRSKSDLVLYFIVAFATVSPWFIKNYFIFKNPVWPLLIHWIGLPNRAQHFEQLHEWSCFRNPNPRLWFDFPLRSLYKPTTSPLASHYFFIPLAILMLAVGKIRALPFVLALLAAAFYYPSIMVFETNWWRFLLPFTIFGCLYYGWAYHQPARPLFAKAQGAIKAFAWIVFVPAFFIRFYTLPTALAGIRPTPTVTARDYYLTAGINVYPLYQRINRELPNNVRIMLFNENRGYYLDRDYLWGDPEIQDVIDYEHLPNGEALYQRLKTLGVTHILVNGESIMYSLSTGKSVFEPSTIEKVNEVTTHHATPVMRQGAIVLYKLL